MKTPEQLKGKIRSMAEKRNLRPQEVLQMYLFERILERLANSPYSDNFILKGGLLISSMIGISERTTMDMDTTVRGITMEEDEIVEVIKNILLNPVDDGIEFKFESIEPIRDDDTYNNFRAHIKAKYGKINAPMKIDITTGDSIIPGAIRYEYQLTFEEKSVGVMAYSLETVLAEKYETIIRRNIGTTRARDFYDLHILYQQHKNEIRMNIFKEAVLHTAQKRESLEDIHDWKDILRDIREEPALYSLWNKYREETPYASEYEFSDVLETVETIAKEIDL